MRTSGVDASGKSSADARPKSGGVERDPTAGGRAGSATASATGTAMARAALAGNPSDGYGGATLAVTLPAQRAEARASLARTGEPAVDPPSQLVAATVSRFACELAPGASGASVQWTTSIPRAVGLGGSSAIVIATLRALSSLHAVRLEPAELASVALAVEVEDLGIAAGLQDRVAQAYAGLTFMDFDRRRAGPGARGRYEPLEPSLLPPFFIAWRSDAGADSGPVHGDLRARFERGDALVRRSMAELAGLARSARRALLERDLHAFARCVDASFDARRRMLSLDQRHVEMIECARAAGASANYTGSGGAIVGVCSSDDHRVAAVDALAAIGCATLA
jgi:galactokinase/mevalonate kinase-like predicted kinase